jgi:hypothetical protein
MNILFCYLYRDGSNYKQYHEIVFGNPLNRKIEEIENLLTQKLIDGLWFVAEEWDIPNQFFKEYPWDYETDHNWHEYIGIAETKNTITESSTIEEFLYLIEKTKLPW